MKLKIFLFLAGLMLGASAFSQVVKDSLNPQWNESFTFQVRDVACAVVVFTLWDYDNVTNDDIIADHELTIAQLQSYINS